jgi:hypothetical protein
MHPVALCVQGNPGFFASLPRSGDVATSRYFDLGPERTAAELVFSKRGASLRADSRSAPVSIPVLKEILLRSRLASSKTAQIWDERMAKCERSNASVSQFGQSIGCSPTSCYQWQRTLAAKPQTSVFLRVLTPSPPRIRSRSDSPKQARGLRR